MQLTREQEEILNGSQGEMQAKVLKTLVMYGEAFGAERLVKVTGKYGHLVTSFGIGVMKPVYKLMDELLQSEAVSGIPFTVDPRPLDDVVPKSFLERLVFHFMYSKQEEYEKQLKAMGLLSDDAYTCTCYFDEVGNTPKKGEILSWAESSAVNYANSVLGARCNRNSGIIEMFGLIAGWVPEFGLLTDEGRKADLIVEVETETLPEAQLLGSAIGIKAVENVPYIKGLDRFLGRELNDEVKAYFKDMGAAMASNGAVGLYHVENLTPEAKESGTSLIRKKAEVYTITESELLRIRSSYPDIRKNKNAPPELCFIGCPHLSKEQLIKWTGIIEQKLNQNKKSKVSIPTVMTSPRGVLKEFSKTEEYKRLKSFGLLFSETCPLMYMNNPLCAKKSVITNSNKLRTYTTAVYYKDDEIADLITGGF
ncbi:aconitase X [Treponema denticola]|uniref:aconitase X n=1 Tax=Treponema denticola TaxID=158 RepID=UPI0011CC6E3D|nr:aconitase X [Treponema denticola]